MLKRQLLRRKSYRFSVPFCKPLLRQVPKQDKIVIWGSGLNIIFVIFAPSSSSSTSCPWCHLWLNYRVPCRAEILQIYSDLPNLFIFRHRALIRCLFNLCEILFNPCNSNVRAELKSVSSVQSVVKKEIYCFGVISVQS